MLKGCDVLDFNFFHSPIICHIFFFLLLYSNSTRDVYIKINICLVGLNTTNKVLTKVKNSFKKQSFTLSVCEHRLIIFVLRKIICIILHESCEKSKFFKTVG